MALDLVFWLSVLAFGWGASLVTYRWFALINGWPMVEWQASRPGLPVTIGVVAIAFALLFALARGGTTGLVVPLLGVLLALAWTALLRVGAQSALLLAPAATVLLVLVVDSPGTEEVLLVSPEPVGAVDVFSLEQALASRVRPSAMATA